MLINDRIKDNLKQPIPNILYQRLTFSSSDLYKCFSKNIPQGFKLLLNNIDLIHSSAIVPKLKIQRMSSNRILQDEYIQSDLVCGFGQGEQRFNAMPIQECYVFHDIIFIELKLDSFPAQSQNIDVMVYCVLIPETELQRGI